MGAFKQYRPRKPIGFWLSERAATARTLRYASRPTQFLGPLPVTMTLELGGTKDEPLLVAQVGVPRGGWEGPRMSRCWLCRLGCTGKGAGRILGGIGPPAWSFRLRTTGMRNRRSLPCEITLM